MSTDHPNKVSEAVNTIFEEMRRLQRENLELRAKLSQKQACLELTTQERDDARTQHQRLRDHYHRIEKPA